MPLRRLALVRSNSVERQWNRSALQAALPRRHPHRRRGRSAPHRVTDIKSARPLTSSPPTIVNISALNSTCKDPITLLSHNASTDQRIIRNDATIPTSPQSTSTTHLHKHLLWSAGRTTVARRHENDSAFSRRSVLSAFSTRSVLGSEVVATSGRTLASVLGAAALARRWHRALMGPCVERVAEEGQRRCAQGADEPE